MAGTTFDAFLNALKTRLETRPALSGVNVFTGWVGNDGGLESIQFQRGRGTITWAALGNRTLQEDYDIDGFIWIAKAGAGETVIQTVRARAVDIFDEILEALRDDPPLAGTVQVSRTSDLEWDSGVTGDGLRSFNLSFTLSVQARLRA